MSEEHGLGAMTEDFDVAALPNLVELHCASLNRGFEGRRAERGRLRLAMNVCMNDSRNNRAESWLPSRS
jgi:hypothetical protein